MHYTDAIASYLFNMTRRFAEEIVDTAQFLCGLLGIAGMPPAFFSIMMFDAPGSARLSTYVLAASVMSFPPACFISFFLSGRALCAGAPSRACAWTILPLVNVAVFGASLTWIQLFQDGRFNG